MQNSTTSNGSTSWAAHEDDGVQSRNLAAIALAEAMQRARSQYHSETVKAVEPVIPAISPKQSLDALRKKLKPLYAAIPQEVEGMDLGVVRDEKPRLYLDMIAFVDMQEDQKSYRLVQSGRNGPQVLLETADDTALITRITDYIAHRLIARDRILEQGDPVVAGAEHFSRGVSAGVAQTQTVAEPYLIPPKAQTTSVTPSEPAQAPVFATVALPQAMEKPIAAGKILQTEPVQSLLNHQSTTAKPELRKALSISAQSESSNTKNGQESNAQDASLFSVNSNAMASWWLWPTLAVLLGMTFAAYLLYLYSMSFNV